MANRKTYHVIKTKDGWQGKLEGSQRASVTGPTKQVVQKITIDLAKKSGKSSVKIHKSDGTFQEERTYLKKNDPFPPEG